jgi:hypothetical protein
VLLNWPCCGLNMDFLGAIWYRRDMVELSSEQLKPYFTKGGQGKFFPDPKPVAEHRYPRGYTPERMKEVREAPMEISIAPKRTQKTSDPYKVRKVQETIARSSTPMSEIESQYGHPSLRIRMGLRLRQGWGGVFESENRTVKVANSPPKPVSPEMKTVLGKKASRISRVQTTRRREENYQGTEHTLLHEMGHFRSHVEKQPHSRYWTPEEQGQEEAFADTSMLERHRVDPRSERRGDVRLHAMSYEDPKINNAAFRAAYAAKRQELSRGTSIPPNIREHRHAREAARFAEHNRVFEHQNTILNTQLFHREYAEEDQFGFKPGTPEKGRWVPNKDYVGKNT